MMIMAIIIIIKGAFFWDYSVYSNFGIGIHRISVHNKTDHMLFRKQNT